MAHQILLHEIDLMPGVAETLPFLAERHQLLLCTKGEPAEQTRKIDLSGLRPFFRECLIVKEKNRETYQRLATERGLDLQKTWMIGNSPKSDINTSLAAGLRAVLIPHERTWTLEREEIRDPHGRMLVAHGFADLLRIFVADGR
jgi:putative hydrolase of the HAD superfamily